MRVISGSAKSLKLKSPGKATRPITDRVKENLFNILGVSVIGANVLDLFAGAGSVGIEALSRGANHATFVELDPEALEALRHNLKLTRLAAKATVLRAEVFRFIRRPTKDLFDLVYVAPPQYKGLWHEALGLMDRQQLLTPAGLIVAQIHPKEFHAQTLALYSMSDQRTYGNTMLCFFKRSQE